MKTYYFLLIALFSLMGCTSRTQPTTAYDAVEADVQVEVIPSDDTLKLSDIYTTAYDIVAFHPVVLSYISDIIKYDSTWIVWGQCAEGHILQFDGRGAYCKTLLGIGNGPKEAVDVISMKLYGNSLYCLVNYGTELLKLNLTDGSEEWRMRMPDTICSAADFEPLSENQFLFLKSVYRGSPTHESRLYAYDRTANRILAERLELDRRTGQYISFGQKNCLYRYRDSIRYYEVFRKGILQYNDTRLDLQGYLSFVENVYSFPDDRLFGEYTFESFIETCEESPYIWAHSNLYEGERFITSVFRYRHHLYLNVIDKCSSRSHSYRWMRDDIVTDAVTPVEEGLSRLAVAGRVHYYTLSYDCLSRLIESKPASGFNQQLQDATAGMNEDANDLVICLYEK